MTLSAAFFALSGVADAVLSLDDAARPLSFDAAWQAGQAMTIDQAMELAVSEAVDR